MAPALMEPQETEIVTNAKRRRFTAQEKLRILKEADACMQPGELGALSRRERPSERARAHAVVVYDVKHGAALPRATLRASLIPTPERRDGTYPLT
jgi:hypothetical protein